MQKPSDPNGMNRPLERSRLKLVYEIPHNLADSVGDKATFHLSGQHLRAALGGKFGLSQVVIGPVDSRMGMVGLTLHYDQDGRMTLGKNTPGCLTGALDDDSDGTDDSYDSPHGSDANEFLLMASGMKLSSTVIHLPENGAGDRCDGEDFERGLGITLQKLDNAPASAAVSFVQLLLVRPRLFSAPAPIFQLCASAEVVFALDHSEDFAVEGNECSAFIGPDALRRASGLSAECLSRVTHLNVLAVHSSSSVGPVGLTMHHDAARAMSIQSPTRTVFVSGMNGCAMAYHHVITPMNAFDRHAIELADPCDFRSGFCVTLHRLTQGNAGASAALPHPESSEIRLEVKYLQSDAPNR